MIFLLGTQYHKSKITFLDPFVFLRFVLIQSTITMPIFVLSLLQIPFDRPIPPLPSSHDFKVYFYWVSIFGWKFP